MLKIKPKDVFVRSCAGKAKPVIYFQTIRNFRQFLLQKFCCMLFFSFAFCIACIQYMPNFYLMLHLMSHLLFFNSKLVALQSFTMDQILLMAELFDVDRTTRLATA